VLGMSKYYPPIHRRGGQTRPMSIKSVGYNPDPHQTPLCSVMGLVNIPLLTTDIIKHYLIDLTIEGEMTSYGRMRVPL